MVLQTERCTGAAFQQHPGATYQQQSHWSNQIQDGGYSNFSTVSNNTTPYSNYSQMSAYSSGNPQNHQSGWSTGAGYHGNGASYYPGGGQCESSFHGSSHSHGSSFSHGHNSYGNGVSYNHSPSGMNCGYQNASWTLKNVDAWQDDKHNFWSHCYADKTRVVTKLQFLIPVMLVCVCCSQLGFALLSNSPLEFIGALSSLCST